MSAPEPAKPDPLVLLARASAAKRRRPLLPALILFVLLGGGLAFVGWYFWPKGEYPAVALAVFDGVALPDERVNVVARLEAVEPFAKDPGLAGSALFVQDSISQEFQRSSADAQGFARRELTVRAEPEIVDLLTRSPGTSGRRRSAQAATARVFVWPAESSLLLVDADRTLIDADEESLWTTNNVDLRPVPGAAAALQAAAAKGRIVYCSRQADRPTRYNKLRAWLQAQTQAETDSFPAGPVLAAGAVPEDERGRFLESTAARLRERFKGPAAAIVRDVPTAQLLRTAGFDTFAIGEADASAEGVTFVKSWAELGKRSGR